MINTIDFACFRLNQGRLEVLLQKRDKPKEPAFGEFALIGGFIWDESREGNDRDLTLDDAIERILQQKVGLKPSYFEQVGAVGSLHRDPRGWSMTVLHFCFFNDEDTERLAQRESMKWVAVDDIFDGQITLPFDHEKLVETAFETMGHKCTYSSLPLYLLPNHFTVAEIIRVMGLFGLDVSKQTVINRWVKSGLIEETGLKADAPTPRGGKKANLYRLKESGLSYFNNSIGRSAA